MIKTFGLFHEYTPDPYPDNFPRGIRFFKDDNGRDYYEERNKLITFDNTGVTTSQPGNWFATVDPDTGRVIAVEQDFSAIAFHGTSLIIYSDNEIRQGQIYKDGKLIDPEPLPDIPDTYFVRSGDLWERLTDSEAEQVEAAIATQPIRIQNIFRARTEYHSNHELFPLLTTIAETLFGEERAFEILAPST